MKRMAFAWMVLGLGAGACSSQLGTVVRQVHVEGRALVVERCFVKVWDGRLSATDCFLDRVVLPREVVLTGCPGRVPERGAEAEISPALTPEQVTAGVDAVRARVLQCAPLLPGGGVIQVRLDIGRTGVVVSTTLEHGGADLTACVRQAFEKARFAEAYQGTKVTVPFELPP